MKHELEERLNQYLIDLNEEFFDENDNVELVNTWINREKLEKFIDNMSLLQRHKLEEADKKVFEYMKKYQNKPVYSVLEHMAEIIENSKLHQTHLEVV